MATPTIPVPNGNVKHTAKAERCAWVCFPASQGGWWARFRQLSTDGLTLLLSQRFEPGALVFIEIQAKRKAFSLAARVVRATPEENRRWLIGCEFLSPLSEDEVQTFVGPEP
jgi:hypothetical protein